MKYSYSGTIPVTMITGLRINGQISSQLIFPEKLIRHDPIDESKVEKVI